MSLDLQQENSLLKKLIDQLLVNSHRGYEPEVITSIVDQKEFKSLYNIFGKSLIDPCNAFKYSEDPEFCRDILNKNWNDCTDDILLNELSSMIRSGKKSSKAFPEWKKKLIVDYTIQYVEELRREGDEAELNNYLDWLALFTELKEEFSPIFSPPKMS